MKKRKYKSSATYGSDFEQEVFRMLESIGLPFVKETTLTNSKVRKIDLGCDIEVKVNGKSVFIELKTKQDHQCLSYDLTGNKERSLKNHQIKRLHYLVIQFRPNKHIKEVEMYVLSKQELIEFIACHSKNSISRKDCAEFGTKIEDMRWLND